MTDANESRNFLVDTPLLTLKNDLLLNAVVRGELPTVRRLLDRHGADINTINTASGLSCLQLAILNKHTKLAEYLIQKGVNIHSLDCEGWSALHDAALTNNTALVKKLIAKGLSLLLTTKQGELPIDVAGGIATERFICEEMFMRGEYSLAHQYYHYLGLQCLSDTEVYELPRSTWSRNSGPSANRNTKHFRSYGPTSAKCRITNGSNLKALSKTKWPGTGASRTSSEHVFGVTPYQPTWSSSNNSPKPHPRNYLNGKHYEVSRNVVANCTLERLPKIVASKSHTWSNSLPKLYKKQQTPKPEKDELVKQDKVSRVVHQLDSNSLSSDSNSSVASTSGLPIEPTKSSLDTHPPPTYEYASPTTTRRKGTRESSAINSLYKHSSFQLQIGFSLSHCDQGSSLDDEYNNEDTFTDLSGDCGGSSTSRTSRQNLSPASNRRLLKQQQVGRGQHCGSIPRSVSFDNNTPPVLSHSDSVRSSCSDSITTTVTTANSLSTTNSLLDASSSQNTSGSQHSPTSIIRRRHKPPLQKSVSFADIPMTRTRPVSYPSGIPNSSPAAESSSGTTTTTATQKSGGGLSPAELAHLSVIFKEQINKGTSDEEGEGDFEAGIKALKMKPRKSSIVSPQRRRSSDGRRRSVSFQPEVLLHEIVIDGDASAISRMLESGIIEDVNKMSPAGLTALHQCAVDGNLECAKALVVNGANVNCMDCESWTPLHASAMTGRMEFVRFLLSAGANPTLKNNAGETPYDIAKSSVIRKMLLHAMNGKSLDADVFSDNEYSGEEEEEYSHAESDSEDEEGSNELFDSSDNTKTPLKERLGLNHSCALKNTQENSTSPSPDQDNTDVFSTAMRNEVNHSSSDVLDLPPKGREVSDSTSSYSSLDVVDQSVMKKINGVKVSTSVSSKSTPAQQQQNQTALSDTDKVSEDQGISTMDGGSTSDCSHRSRTLSEDEGTLRDALDDDLIPGSMDYKFQKACLHTDIDSVFKLVKYKDQIHVDRVNSTSGITALHHAVLEENFTLVQHLVKDFNACIHVQDRDGWTPLHAASAVGTIRIAQFLLENGAKTSVLNHSCEFPVDVAEDKEIEKLLKNAMLGSTVGKVL